MRHCKTAGLSADGRNELRSSFEFTDKVRFAAKQDTINRRSENFKLPTEERIIDVWTLKPPNFNPQAFAVKLPERNSREAVRPERYNTESGEQYETVKTSAADRKKDHRREAELRAMVREASSIHLPPSELSRRPPFGLRFRMKDAHEARLHSVKHGTYKLDQYQMPKPHDFRQYPPLKSLGLPEFLTSYEHDPMGLKFKSRRLNTITGPGLQVVQRDVEPGSNLSHSSPRPQSWDKKLVLPKYPFPNKIHAFSRHRRIDRSARSAFLERAEAMMIKRARELESLRSVTHTLKQPHHQSAGQSYTLPTTSSTGTRSISILAS